MTPRIRRPGFWALCVAVVLVHLLVSNGLLESHVGWGAGQKPPPRIEVTFVRELAATAPPPMAAPVAVARRRLPSVAAKPVAAASAPERVASAPALVASAPAELAPPVLAEVALPPAAPVDLAAPIALAVAELAPPLAAAPAASAPDVAAPNVAAPDVAAPDADGAAASAPAAAVSAAAASAVPFEWPPSTRLTYRLSGDYRGPVEGSASVEWLRQGSRYQVHLETAIGPVLSRHITSEGELTENGLAPRRFDGEQKVLFRAPRRWQLRFGPEVVVLSDGKEVPTQPGVQDEASQFVQLTWLFTTQPDRLKVGRSVELPLAISRKLERWTYDVIGEETLRFDFGEVAAYHLKPRRAAQGGDLTPEMWIAPSLQYLPVRILIRDTQGNWIDLTLDKLPLQAAQK